jgi:hypothetical protein
MAEEIKKLKRKREERETPLVVLHRPTLIRLSFANVSRKYSVGKPSWRSTRWNIPLTLSGFRRWPLSGKTWYVRRKFTWEISKRKSRCSYGFTAKNPWSPITKLALFLWTFGKMVDSRGTLVRGNPMSRN